MTKRLDGTPPALAVATTIASASPSGTAIRACAHQRSNRSNGSGSAPATSKVSDGSGAGTSSGTAHTLPGDRMRIEGLPPSPERSGSAAREADHLLEGGRVGEAHGLRDEPGNELDAGSWRPPGVGIGPLGGRQLGGRLLHRGPERRAARLQHASAAVPEPVLPPHGVAEQCAEVL